MTKLILILFTSLLLTSCGFHLQNEAQIPDKIRSMQLSSTNPYGPFELSLIKNFRLMGIQLSHSNHHQAVVIKILSTHLNHTRPTLGTTAQARRFTFRYRIRYALTDQHGKIIAGPLTVIDTQTLILNPDQLLQTNDQANLLQTEMQRELARKMLYQLTSPHVQHALS